jgi:hypothetical protein
MGKSRKVSRSLASLLSGYDSGALDIAGFELEKKVECPSGGSGFIRESGMSVRKNGECTDAFAD